MYSQPTGDFQTTSLSGVLAAGATSATIGTGLTIAATNGILQASYDTDNAIGAIDGPETFSYAAYNSGTGALTGLVRGLAGTTDVQHSSGQSVQCAPSALNFGTGQVSGSMLATTAVTLGYAERTGNFTTTTVGSNVDVTNLAVTVTVPAGGRRMKITGYCGLFNAGGGGQIDWIIKEGSTQLTKASLPDGTKATNISAIYSAVPTAGSHTYKIAIQQGVSGTATVFAAATYPAFILVELI